MNYFSHLMDPAIQLSELDGINTERAFKYTSQWHRMLFRVKVNDITVRQSEHM